eukprot:scaffold9484_cov124-Isochrysis_galbana.AAC.5
MDRTEREADGATYHAPRCMGQHNVHLWKCARGGFPSILTHAVKGMTEAARRAPAERGLKGPSRRRSSPHPRIKSTREKGCDEPLIPLMNRCAPKGKVLYLIVPQHARRYKRQTSSTRSSLITPTTPTPNDRAPHTIPHTTLHTAHCTLHILGVATHESLRTRVAFAVFSIFIL